MSTATNRELVALRACLAAHLDPADLRTLAWPVVASAAGPGIGRGWLGAELGAAAVLGAYSGGVENVGAYVVASLRDLAAVDPPRQVTPQPAPVRAVLAELRPAAPSADHATWLQLIRGGGDGAA